jgi:hypothetical protein
MKCLELVLICSGVSQTELIPISTPRHSTNTCILANNKKAIYNNKSAIRAKYVSSTDRIEYLLY